MIRRKKISPGQKKFHPGDRVAFKLEKQKFVGKVLKPYTNSFLIAFNSDDPTIVDKYHNRTVINNKDLKLIKKATHRKPAKNKNK